MNVCILMNDKLYLNLYLNILKMVPVLIIIFVITAIIGFIMLVAGLILAETKYNGVNNPWQVHVLVWGGLIIFVFSLIFVAIVAGVMSRKKKQMCGDVMCGDIIPPSQRYRDSRAMTSRY